MKLYIKLILWIIFVVIVGLLVYFYITSMKQEEETYQADIFSFIPKNTKSILQINNLDMFSKQLAENVLKDFPDEKMLDWTKSLNRFIFPLKSDEKSFPGWGKGRILISFHDKGEMYYTKLRSDEIAVWKEMLENKIFPPFPPVIQKYEGKEILHYSLADNRFFSCVFNGGIFIGSFNSKLIEEAVSDWKNGTSVKSDPNFIRTSKTAGKKTLAILFYYVDKNNFFLTDTTEPNLNIEGWTSSDVSFPDNEIWLSGYYLPNDKTHDFSASIGSLKSAPLLRTRLFPRETVLIRSQLFDLNAIQSETSESKTEGEHSQKNISALNDLFLKYTENELHVVYLKDSIKKEISKVYCLKINQKEDFEKELRNYPNVFVKEKFITVKNPDLLSDIFRDNFFSKGTQYHLSFFEDYAIISRNEEALGNYLNNLAKRSSPNYIDLAKKPGDPCHISVLGDLRSIRQYKNSILQFQGITAEYPDFFSSRKMGIHFTKGDEFIFYHIVFKQYAVK